MEIDQLIADRPESGVFRLHRSAHTSSEILALERKLVFDRCWLYVGHESEVENPGDYRRRTVAGRPLFIVRGADNEVRVFFNTCTHRGAMICRHDDGQANSFQCFYHAWTFNNKGELIGVPDIAGYRSGFDKRDYALKSPARVEQYRGFYFISFDPDIEDLKSHLGSARELIDLTIDSAEVLGGWAVLRGSAKYSIKANWKLLVENSYDGYHLTTVHQTYLEYMAWRRKLSGGTQDDRTGKATRSFALSNGHGGMVQWASGRTIANPSPLWSDDVNQEVRRIKSLNIERFGEERGCHMSEVSRHLLIFPNLAFQDSQTGFRLRQIWPVAPDLMDVVQWDFVPRNERQDLRAARMESSLAFLGPGGLATPDDVEALESCQQGLAATEVEWSDLSRGMQREPQKTDELQIRAFWRQWHALLQNQRGAVTTDDRRRDSATFSLIEA